MKATIDMPDDLYRRVNAESVVGPLGSAATVLATPPLASANPGLVDRLIHAEYMQSVKEVLTFENASSRLTGVRVLVAY
jgi:hypothetical protein